MAAYSWVYGFGHLRADCPGQGSDLEPCACTSTSHLTLSNNNKSSSRRRRRRRHLHHHISVQP